MRKVEKVKPVKRTQERTTKRVHQKNLLHETTSRCFLPRSFVAAIASAKGRDTTKFRNTYRFFPFIHLYFGSFEVDFEFHQKLSIGCSKPPRKVSCLWRGKEKERERGGHIGLWLCWFGRSRRFICGRCSVSGWQSGAACSFGEALTYQPGHDTSLRVREYLVIWMR
jgi:hypothetical protein